MPPARSYGTIKVVRIIARLNIGGPAIQTVILTEGLKRPRFASYLITGTVGPDEGEMTYLAQDSGIQPLVISEFGREISWFDDFRAFAKLVKTLKAIQPDIVHTHTAKAGTLGRLAALLSRVPIRVHTFHGHVFKGYFSRMKTWWFILIERCLSRITDRIIVLSTRQREELVNVYKIGPRQKFHIVPLGFDLTSFFREPSPGDLRLRLGFDPTDFVIIFAGRLAPVKNPFLAIEAFHQLDLFVQGHRRPEGPSVILMVIGGGQLSDGLKHHVQEKGLSSKAHFLGWRRDMADMYAISDVVVLTSLNEGTPVVLIEAMASGKPFIATNVGGVPDLVVGEGKEIFGPNGGRFTRYENGILIASEDVAGLTGALLYIMENPQASREMGQTGKEFVAKRFTKDRLLGDVESLYEELIRVKKPELSRTYA